ncbi:phage portal protein [Halococcus sp. PRR34]|uniref:phage portal protein n=1 Tax=Halococcus sp. PRR34 TaxID=3020830 RepID=UPI00235F5987|nr:phage portal protein [Halococcus sp. PRR34]
MSDNSLFARAVRDHRARQPDDNAGTTDAVGASAAKAIEDPDGVASETSETIQPIDEDSWLNVNEWGIPRGPEAYEAQQLAQTAPFEIVKSTVVDQITGGELTFPTADEDAGELGTDAKTLRDIFRDVLTGPHLLGDDFDDLITAAIADMLEQGDAHWETLAAESNAEAFPVRKLKPVPSITIQYNVDEHGNWEDTPYYQAPYQSFAGGTIARGNVDPAELDHTDLVSMRWPGSRRADRIYPLSPALQVKQYLEALKNNITHLNRWYKDDEIPAGLIAALEASDDDVSAIKETIEDASGDPRTAPVVGTDAKWIEMGGSAIDLDLIEEQKWFLQLVWGALGLSKNEIGLVEDVNRDASSNQSEIIYKRITLPLTKTICQAVKRQVFTQFDAYESLGKPFGVSIDHTDPVREQRRQERLNTRWKDGTLSFNEQAQRRGEEPGDTEVELPNGTTFDYGPHPKYIGETLIDAHRQADSSSGGDGSGGSDPSGDESDDDQDAGDSEGSSPEDPEDPDDENE